MAERRVLTAVWSRLAMITPVYAAIYAVSYTLAWLLRLDFAPSPEAWQRCVAHLPIVILIKVMVMIQSFEWQRRHRYTSLNDLVHTVAACLAGTAMLALFNLVLPGSASFPRSILLLDALLTLLFLCGGRAGFRLWLGARPTLLQAARRKSAIIVGSCEEAFQILRSLESANPNYRVVAIYDELAAPTTTIMAGVRVYGLPYTIPRIASNLNAADVLAPSSLPGRRLRDLVSLCRDAGLKFHVIPKVDEIVDGRFKLGIRDVHIADLLRREPAQLDLASISGYITGRRVLVTGAAGSIGSELCRQLAALGPSELTLVDQSECGIFQMEQEFSARSVSSTTLSYVIGDITNRESMGQVLSEKAPEIMFHAAAYKHVPLMEHNPREAVRNNVLGTKNLVDLAIEHHVERFVLISTDKAVRPTSLMGATKLLAEKYLQGAAAQSKTQFITVRFGNVLNSAGSVVPTFRKQIEAGGPVTVTHPDMVRFFMTIPEAVQLVLQAGAVGESGDVLILDMGEPVKIVDLAKDMILLSGLRYPEDIDISFSGMRPGEKLYEELFYETESGAERVHEKIFRGNTAPPAFGVIASQLAQLKSGLNGSPRDMHRAVMELARSYAEAQSTPTAERRAA